MPFVFNSNKFVQFVYFHYFCPLNMRDSHFNSSAFFYGAQYHANRLFNHLFYFTDDDLLHQITGGIITG